MEKTKTTGMEKIQRKR
jgi:hypothetical protein